MIDPAFVKRFPKLRIKAKKGASLILSDGTRVDFAPDTPKTISTELLTYYPPLDIFTYIRPGLNDVHDYIYAEQTGQAVTPQPTPGTGTGGTGGSTGGTGGTTNPTPTPTTIPIIPELVLLGVL